MNNSKIKRETEFFFTFLNFLEIVQYRIQSTCIIEKRQNKTNSIYRVPRPILVNTCHSHTVESDLNFTRLAIFLFTIFFLKSYQQLKILRTLQRADFHQLVCALLRDDKYRPIRPCPH